MYPNFYYIFRDWFGVEWQGLQVVNSFGFFVAISFIAAAWILSLEFKRKQKQGLLHPTEEKRWVGHAATVSELLSNFLLGFVFGYKLIGVLVKGVDDGRDPQQFLFSADGNWPIGIFLGLLFAGLKWYEKNKTKLDKPEERTIRIWPHDRVGDITIVAAVFGFLGAKIFDNLEHWNEFIKDPIGSIFSASGLAFYGGLILAAIAVIWYGRKRNIGTYHLIDAAAPGLMLAYALGRIGCHVSGDGDWGIPNTHPKPFSWLPDWLWAYDYPHNVSNSGVRLEDCVDDKFCNHLVPPVYPTPIYETIICLGLFLLLWTLRKRLKIPGQMFGLYLVLNGIERFFIEQIRVNIKYDIMGLKFTQAEFIAIFLILAGAGLFFWVTVKRRNKKDPAVI
jgi:prolipoprotein diacylglyceryl transferase